jgi:hypothetical protein
LDVPHFFVKWFCCSAFIAAYIHEREEGRFLQSLGFFMS